MEKITEYFNISRGNWYFQLLIIILLYLIINWIVGKFIKKGISKIIVTAASSVILTPIIYSFFVIIFFSFIFYEYHPELKFNSIQWTENKNDRHHMRKDLIESELLIGKTKNEVVRILGKPENNFKVYLDTLKNWNYSMGSQGHGMGWKFHYLDLYFKNGKIDSIKNTEFID
ncbi:hypothetical protein [Tenacibaculum salmonis]|uniref:hypothetical protein n=1 Tax=Tenacibaculum sp. P3-BQ1 TaxID=3232310 RepID=UPI0034DF9960